jgi:DedD protein
MDQELKQRLIGAAVITALAAIFVPMLFDDAVDETGKEVNALTLPPLPAKEQDVEIVPLPEKTDDVISSGPPTEKSLKTESVLVEEEAEVPKHITRLSANTKVNPSPAPTSSAGKRATGVPLNVPEGDVDQALPEAEDVAPVVKHAKLPPQTPVVTLPATPSVVKKVKPAKDIEPPSVDEASAKPAQANDTGTRWYLNAGSFSQKANAVTLQDTLKQQGFATTLKEVTTDKGTVFKVRIGPMLDKLKAQAVKNKLAQINVNSFVSPDE